MAAGSKWGIIFVARLKKYLICVGRANERTPLHEALDSRLYGRLAPDALVGDIYATLGEEVFNIAKAQGKPEIQPDGVLDYGTRKTVAEIGYLFHQRKLPHQPGRSHSVTVTAPSSTHPL